MTLPDRFITEDDDVLVIEEGRDEEPLPMPPDPDEAEKK